MKRRVDLNLLVIFESIYRSRNLTAAGASLGLSQPAMSHALRRLRATFDDPLFVRLPRGLQPTPLADEIAPVLEEGLAAIRGTMERQTFDAATSSRVFNIGMGDIAEVVHLPKVVRDLRRSAPHVRLNSIGIPGPRLNEALADGEIDIATGNHQLGAGCRELPLYEGEYACIARADHPVIGSRISLQQFKAAEHILVVPKGASQRAQFMEGVLTSRKINARIALQVSNFFGVLALVTSSDLIATIPRRLGLVMQQFADINVLRPPMPLPRIKVSLYWHERFHRDPGNAWLRSAYIKAFKD